MKQKRTKKQGFKRGARVTGEGTVGSIPYFSLFL